MSFRRSFPALLALALAACSDPAVVRSTMSGLALRYDGGRARSDDAAGRREYGPSVAVGNGVVRTYVLLDRKDGRVPLELGVAISEGAMEGLPAPNPNHHDVGADGHEHVDSHVYDLAMPAQNPTPYRFVEFDWNPAGHVPPGIYSFPHFDFHFYTVPVEVRNAIDPKALGNEQFAAKSASLPAKDEWSPFVQALAAPGQPIMAVPRMGTHWVDVRTPELQGLLGNPAGFRQFTTTFLRGSWDGRFIFDEPMITRAFILGRKAAKTAAQRDSVIALPMPQRRNAAGYYPAAYRIAYDAKAKEYRIGLTQLAWRD